VRRIHCERLYSKHLWSLVELITEGSSEPVENRVSNEDIVTSCAIEVKALMSIVGHLPASLLPLLLNLDLLLVVMEVVDLVVPLLQHIVHEGQAHVDKDEP